MIEPGCRLFSLDAFTPRHVIKNTLQCLHFGAGLLRPLACDHDVQIALVELQNKLETFVLFRYIDLMVSPPLTATDLLDGFVAEASSLGPYSSVWATEGIGNYYANRCLEKDRLPKQLLNDDKTKNLEGKRLIPLHTGMGLALAAAWMASIEYESITSDAINNFVQLCRNNSRPGYFGMVFEAVGLVARSLYPQLVGTIDQQLCRQDEQLLGYFWHGVGRALYFTPSNFLPSGGAQWKAVADYAHEAPHALARKNFIAGLAWAIALVNVRHPEVMASFLKRHVHQVEDREAFTNGICSAFIIWNNASPGDGYLERFREYEASQTQSFAAEFWNQHVRRACNDALDYSPAIREHAAFGEVFRFQDLPALISSFDRRDTIRQGSPSR